MSQFDLHLISDLHTLDGNIQKAFSFFYKIAKSCRENTPKFYMVFTLNFNIWMTLCFTCDPIGFTLDFRGNCIFLFTMEQLHYTDSSPSCVSINEDSIDLMRIYRMLTENGGVSDARGRLH